MKFYKISVTAFLGVFFLSSCKGPSSPSFEFEHAIQIPLLNNKKLEFLGGANALLDTTSVDFASLFKTDPDGLVRIVFDTGFNMGDFTGTLPGMEVEPDHFNSDIGSLEASFSGNGSASCEEVAGEPCLGGSVAGGESGDIFIGLDIDDLERGVVEEGGIRLTFTNELGMDINTLNAELIADGNSAGSAISLSNIEKGDVVSDIILFQENEVIDNGGDGLSIKVNIIWDDQETEEGTELAVNASADQLYLNEVTASLDSQYFTSDDSFILDDNDFHFEEENHYVRLASGKLNVLNLVNNIDLDIDNLHITVPGIISPEGNPLEITFTGDSKIQRSSQTATAREVDLDGYRIHAPGNILEYQISGVTENTGESADPIRTVYSENYIEADVEISGLVIGEAVGIVQKKMVSLNNGNGSDDILDLFNESQVEVTRFDDFEFFTERIQDLSFFNTELNFIYTTNFGIETIVYGAILGINEKGEKIYLSGKQDTEFEVSTEDDIQGLHADGQEINRSDLIRLNTEASSNMNGSMQSQAIVLDNSNSNIEEFISNMPVEIRFIGKSLANPESREGFIQDPIIFDTKLGMDIPMNIATNIPAVFEDTFPVDLSGLPGNNDETFVSEAILAIHYENSLPLLLDLSVVFLDVNDVEITRFPIPSDAGNEPARIVNASVDPDSQFGKEIQTGMIEISLLGDELTRINETRQLNLSISLETALSSAVKIRAEDFINLSIFGKFKTKTNVSSE